MQNTFSYIYKVIINIFLDFSVYQLFLQLTSCQVLIHSHFSQQQNTKSLDVFGS